MYYGKVKNLYRNFDSLETAQNKELFLRELKDIRDEIKADKLGKYHFWSRFIYRNLEFPKEDS